jgi:hypothetical protein
MEGGTPCEDYHMTLDPGRVQAVFLPALEQEPSADRPALVDRLCGGDDDPRRWVEALLIAHDRPDSLLDRPFVARSAGVPTMAIRNPR